MEHREHELPVSAHEKPLTKRSLIFISHDSRDAAVAEAFSKLLSSVSAGLLKSFRSSDKKGSQGIEFGVEWYPEIMKKLNDASDVVCLLTPNSIERPWILYEAGVAKGKLDTPVYGVALNIALHSVNSSPFAQFQNSDDSEDAITKLVMQLVGKIPNAEPDRDTVKAQVAQFKANIEPLMASTKKIGPTEQDNEEASISSIFEEIKVMFIDLPTRIEKRISPTEDRPDSKRYRDRLLMTDNLINTGIHEIEESIVILIVASLIREEIPWLYEFAVETYRKIDSKSPDSVDHVKKLIRIFEITLHHPLRRELIRSKDRSMEIEEQSSFAIHFLQRLGNSLESQMLGVSGARNFDRNEKPFGRTINKL